MGKISIIFLSIAAIINLTGMEDKPKLIQPYQLDNLLAFRFGHIITITTLDGRQQGAYWNPNGNIVSFAINGTCSTSAETKKPDIKKLDSEEMD